MAAVSDRRSRFQFKMQRWNLTLQLLLLNLGKKYFAAGKVISLYLAELSQLCFKTTKSVLQELKVNIWLVYAFLQGVEES